jgi:RHS repeat-associated protein
MPVWRFAPLSTAFHGSLLVDKADASGQLYRRNRYYDPAAGRFTQEDPIGLAGGLNLYGFANGDPVNFSDPFGLFPCCMTIGLPHSGLYNAVQQAGEKVELDFAIDIASGGIAGTERDLAKVGETIFTKYGRSAHKLWDAGEGFAKEVTLKSGKRADAVNVGKRIVKELKPDNANAIRRGMAQVEAYAKELSETTGEIWKGIVETYKRTP